MESLAGLVGKNAGAGETPRRGEREMEILTARLSERLSFITNLKRMGGLSSWKKSGDGSRRRRHSLIPTRSEERSRIHSFHSFPPRLTSLGVGGDRGTHLPSSTPNNYCPDVKHIVSKYQAKDPNNHSLFQLFSSLILKPVTVRTHQSTTSYHASHDTSKSKRTQ